MKIKALWGFRGDPAKLGNSIVRCGDVFENVDEEYAHILIGKGLAEEYVSEPTTPGTPSPKSIKPAIRRETK